MELLRGILNRSQRFGRRSERVFVGGELDDLFGGNPQLARDFFDWSAGLIDRQCFERRICFERKFHGNGSNYNALRMRFTSTCAAMMSRMTAIFSVSAGRVFTMRL